jgi:hypothetical protein
VSCPYRRDVPSGVWAPEEYAKLPDYDNATWAQPTGVFCCHQQDGRVCAGWAGTHDMEENFALRVAVLQGTVSAEEYEATVDYETAVPLFASGREAAEHGLAELERPGPAAVKTITRLARKLG